MPHSKNPDYYPVRITWLENAVENIGILEKSGVSDYTLFGMSMPERSWSLPDACNTYTSYYYDKPLDLDFENEFGDWSIQGSVNYGYSNGSMNITFNSWYSSIYTSFDTEIDSTYSLVFDFQGINFLLYLIIKDDQDNIIDYQLIDSQTSSPISIDFEAIADVTILQLLIMQYSNRTITVDNISVTGKYHKEDVMYLSYRYGFNNMEKDDELKGLGNSYDFGARIYDPRVGRWLAVDPLAGKYPDLSPYVFVANSPLIFVDPDGREIRIVNCHDEDEVERFKESIILMSNGMIIADVDEVTGRVFFHIAEGYTRDDLDNTTSLGLFYDEIVKMSRDGDRYIDIYLKNTFVYDPTIHYDPEKSISDFMDDFYTNTLYAGDLKQTSAVNKTAGFLFLYHFLAEQWQGKYIDKRDPLWEESDCDYRDRRCIYSVAHKKALQLSEQKLNMNFGFDANDETISYTFTNKKGDLLFKLSVTLKDDDSWEVENEK